MGTDAEWDEECRLASLIDDRVARRIAEEGQDLLVDFSAYRDGEGGLPVDNLDEVAVRGRVKFAAGADRCWGGEDSRSWESPVLTDPTWLDLAVQANDMMRRTNDSHHSFLEGVEVVGAEGGTQIARFLMGS